MIKFIAQLLEARRMRKHWRNMTKLMGERGPVIVQRYPEKNPSRGEKRYP